MTIPAGSTGDGAPYLNPLRGFDSIIKLTEDTLAEAPVNLKDYLYALDAGTAANRQTVIDNPFSDALLNIDRYRGLGSQSDALDVMYSAILELTARWRVVVNAQTAQSNAINNYNNNSLPTIQTATITLNDAIETYNNIPNGPGFPTPAQQDALQNAIVAYQNAVAPSVNTYNSIATTYNASYTTSLNIENLTRLLYGMPPFAKGAAPLSNVPISVGFPVTRPMSELGIPSGLANISVSSPAPSDSVAIQTYFKSTASIIAIIFFPQSVQLKTAIAFQDQRTQIDEQTLGLPAAFITKKHAVLFSSTDGVPPQGVSSTVVRMAVGTQAAMTDRLTAKAMYSAILNKQATDAVAASNTEPEPVTPSPVSNKLVDKLRTYSLLLVAEAAGNAGTNVSQQVGDQASNAKGVRNYFDVASALAFANSVNGIVSSGKVSEGIREILNTDPDFNLLTLTEKQELIKELVPVVNLSILQFALSQVALTLKTPGLIAQVFGNIPGLKIGDSLQNEDIATVLNDRLDDPLLIVALKENIAKGLESDTVTPEQAASQASQAVNIALSQGKFSDPAAFGAAVKSALTGQGVGDDQAGILGSQAAGTLKTEIELPFLSEPFDPTAIAALVLALKSSSSVELPQELRDIAPAGTVQRQLLTDLYKAGRDDPALVGSLENLLALDNPTVRDSRAHLNEILLARSIPQLIVDHISVKVGGLGLLPVSDDPLLRRHPAGILSRDQILESLTHYIKTKLTPVIGQEADKVASSSSQAVNRLLDNFNDNIRLIREQGNEAALVEFRENARVLSKANLSQYQVKHQVQQGIKSQVETVVSYERPAEQADLRKRVRSPGATGTQTYKADIDIPA
ncbi:MAG: hypothetical protein H0X51_03205 [Parachlamydiaceae bacterium]|nr:hypothetical protein [Parachlamydiaceae bacterium]